MLQQPRPASSRQLKRLGPAVDAEMKEYRSASSAVPRMAWAVVGLMYPSRPVVRPDSSSILPPPCAAKQLSLSTGSPVLSTVQVRESIGQYLARDASTVNERTALYRHERCIIISFEVAWSDDTPLSTSAVTVRLTV
jgi:hypothetical protein